MCMQVHVCVRGKGVGKRMSMKMGGVKSHLFKSLGRISKYRNCYCFTNQISADKLSSLTEVNCGFHIFCKIKR